MRKLLSAGAVLNLFLIVMVYGNAAALSVKKVVIRFQVAEHEMMGQKVQAVDTTSVFYFSETQALIDHPNMKIIYDIGTDSWKTLYPQNEIYSDGKPGEAMQKMSAGVEGKTLDGVQSISTSIEHEPTDDTATIGGYACRRHILRVKTSALSSESELWVSKEVDLPISMRKILFGSAQIGPDNSPQYDEAVSKMDGFMVKSITTSDVVPGLEIVTLLESVEEVEVPEDFFEVPPHYDLYPEPSDE